jgi:hypothetical protein
VHGASVCIELNGESQGSGRRARNASVSPGSAGAS